MFKKCKVVMLHTNEKATILYNKELNHLGKGLLNYNGVIRAGYIHQHLYITSNEGIKKGDYTIFLGTVRKVLTKKESATSAILEGVGLVFDTYKLPKIITSTNPSLNLSSPSPSFIAKFIEEYNKGNIITDIMVEYKDKLHYENTIYKDSNKQTPKVSKDNTIIIKKVKDTFTKDEYIRYIKQAIAVAISYPETFVTGICLDNTKVNNWINNNI